VNVDTAELKMLKRKITKQRTEGTKPSRDF